MEQFSTRAIFNGRERINSSTRIGKAYPIDNIWVQFPVRRKRFYLRKTGDELRDVCMHKYFKSLNMWLISIGRVDIKAIDLEGTKRQLIDRGKLLVYVINRNSIVFFTNDINLKNSLSFRFFIPNRGS